MSVTPVASARERRFVRSGRDVERIRTAEMYAADTKNEIESTMNAVSLPNTSVTTPPSAAPNASVTDHDALDSPLAEINSSRETIPGIAADLAGSKNVAMAISTPASA